MLVTQIDNLFTYIEQLTPSKNKEKIEFSEYEESKEKIMHLRERDWKNLLQLKRN